jgi:hypothetical protein
MIRRRHRHRHLCHRPVPLLEQPSLYGGGRQQANSGILIGQSLFGAKIATFRLSGHSVRELAPAMVPCGWGGWRGARLGYAQRCPRERAASEDLVRRGRFRDEVFVVKGRSLCPVPMYGLKTAADVRCECGNEAKDEETSSTDNEQSAEYVWKIASKAAAAQGKQMDGAVVFLRSSLSPMIWSMRKASDPQSHFVT